jgi:opacity protein-like surface antigen
MNKLKILVLIAFVSLVGNYSIAQTFDLTPTYGWQMNGNIDFYEGELDVEAAQYFGGTLDIMVAEGMGIRLMYSYTEAPTEFRPYYGFEPDFPQQKFTMLNDYYQIGAIRGFKRGNIEPYGVFTLGAARYKGIDNTDIDTESRWKFAITTGLGAKIFFNDRIGIKLEGNFMMPIYFAGIGFYFGTGGSGTSVNGAVPMLQGNFNGGLVIRISK